MRLFHLASALSLFSAVAYAWPTFEGGPGPLDGLLRRQVANGGGDANGNGNGNGNANANGNGNANANTITAAATLKATGTATTKKSTVIDPRLPAGGISMVTPNPALGPAYYKVGDWVHFQWNYTSLSISPTAVNIIASCSAASRTYTLAMNQSIEPTGDVFWDTGAYQQTAAAQLLTNEYTLVVWDAAQPLTATAQAGVLAPYSQFTFGMYVPQPYQNWSDYQSQCPTCNGAGQLERMTIHFLLATAGITVLSFTWFVTNFAAL